MRTLIIGSNGYLGRHLVQAARQAGWSVATSDVQDTAWDGDVSYRRCDVRVPADLAQLSFDVDLVFFFTALSGTTVGFEQYSNYIGVNEAGLVGVLEGIRKMAKPPRVIFPSSRLVYRGQKGIPLKEDAEKDSLSMYAVNKRAGEMYLELYHRIFGVPYTIFRICVPYGNLLDQNYSYGTTGFFMRFARSGKDIPLYGDGSQRRTFSFVSDINAQILSASVKSESVGRVYNIAGADDMSLAEAAGRVAERFGVQLQFTPWPEMDRRCESGDTIFDSSAIQSLTGYVCQQRFRDWVKALV